MKKIFLVLMIAMLGIVSSQAQIRREVYGLTLASTTKSQAIRNMNNKNARLISQDDQFLVYGQVSFGGYTWDNVFLQFNNKGILFKVAFTQDLDSNTLSMYNWLKENLEEKYSGYQTQSRKTGYGWRVSDGVTGVQLEIANEMGLMFIYMDMGIQASMNQEDINEL